MKKGQVTVFVIIGLVVLIAFALVFYLASKSSELRKGPENIQIRLAEIYDNIKSDQIDKCTEKETKKAIDLFLENGGSFGTASSTATYKGKQVRVRCSAISGSDKCLNDPIFLSVAEKEFSSELTNRIGNCIDLNIYRTEGYTIDSGELTANVSINPGTLIVNINYPITIKSGDIEFYRDSFVHNVNIPLGKIIGAVNDVLNDRAQEGIFDPLQYARETFGKVEVDTISYYPNDIYELKIFDYSNSIWFAVTGNSKYQVEA